MSISSAQLYLEKMKTDEAFWEKHKRVRTRKEQQELIKTEGFEFTEEELKKALSQMLRSMMHN